MLLLALVVSNQLDNTLLGFKFFMFYLAKLHNI